MNNNNILKDIFDLSYQAVAASHAKHQRQMEAAKKNEALRQSAILKANITPSIEAVLRNNIYFQDLKHINVYSCVSDSQNNCWKISLDVINPTDYNLESPHVLVSLNDTVDTFFASLQIEMQNELTQLNMMAQEANANPINIQLAYAQICRKYDILNHKLRFVFIKKLEKSKFLFRIGALFR